MSPVRPSLGPFLLGYAEETTARASLLAGNVRLAEAHLTKAKTSCAAVAEAPSRARLEADLMELERRSSEASTETKTETLAPRIMDLRRVATSGVRS
ncbi:hypothetical protein N8917_00750 [bacterium]|nr:hypothetical protein [bacterium]